MSHYTSMRSYSNGHFHLKARALSYSHQTENGRSFSNTQEFDDQNGKMNN